MTITDIGYPWQDNDIIREERANGISAFPEWVEDGAVITIQTTPDGVDITEGIVHVGSFRIVVPPVNIPLAATQKYFIYATCTAQILGGDLIGVQNEQYEAFIAEQVFVFPKYGTLIGITVDDPTPDNYLMGNKNQGLPVEVGLFRGDNLRTVGKRGCDYDSLKVAMEDAATGDTLVLYQGADYVLPEGFQIANKELKIIAANHMDPRDSGLNVQEIEITTAVSPWSGGATGIVEMINSKLYFCGIKLTCSVANDTFYLVDSDCRLYFDSCYLFKSGGLKFINNVNGGKVYVLKSWLQSNVAHAIYLQDTVTGFILVKDSSVYATNFDALDLENGDFVISRSKIIVDGVGKRVIKWTGIPTPGTRPLIYASKLKADDGIPLLAWVSESIDIRNTELESYLPNGTFMDLNATTIYWDSASRLIGDGAVTFAGGATVVRPRTPVLGWETASIMDIGVPKGVAFPGAPIDGDFFYRTDLDHLFRWDNGRSKWLGELDLEVAGRNGLLTSGSYLRRIDGMAMGVALGTYIPYDITIVGITFAKGNGNAGTIEVRRNGILVVGASIATGAGTSGSVLTLNSDFASGGIMSVYWNSGSNTADIQVKVYYRRKAT